jgi:hypothetical protein
MVVADNRDAYWLRNRGEADTRVIEVVPVPAGLSMLTAYDLNDPQSPRTARHLADFRAAAVPDPEAPGSEGGDWAAWQALLARTEAGSEAAMTVERGGFQTVCASLLALPAAPQTAREALSDPLSGKRRRPLWLFAPGRPDRHPFAPLETLPAPPEVG